MSDKSRPSKKGFLMSLHERGRLQLETSIISTTWMDIDWLSVFGVCIIHQIALKVFTMLPLATVST